ncbi:hypothetical protein [Yoonia sp. R78084]|uniref:hypothetical protein n=1 Tax=Yoonia sp. R78084 TaxID=3093869 RepID=UPI0037DC6E07
MTLQFLEAIGTVGLQQDDVTGEYFIVDLDEFGEPIPETGAFISRDGAIVSDLTYPGYVATQAAADDTPDSDGYKVLFQNSENGDIFVWTVTAEGAYVSDVNIAGDAEAIRATEIGFGVDGLDDVEGIGAEPPVDPNTVINSTADVALESTPEGAYVLNDGVTTFAITRDGAPITDTTYAGYIATQAAADPETGGYKVLFENAVNGDLFVWTLTAEGAWVSDVNVAGDAAAIRETEIGFDVDGLDDVEGIGAEPSTDPNTVIDSTEDVALESTASGAYVLNDGVTTFAITRDGAPITDTTYAGYVATQAAADPETGGYKVLFENAVNGDLFVWTLTAEGAYVSDINVAGDAAAIRATEIGFDVDGLDDVEGIGAGGESTVIELDSRRRSRKHRNRRICPERRCDDLCDHTRWCTDHRYDLCRLYRNAGCSRSGNRWLQGALRECRKRRPLRLDTDRRRRMGL